MPFSCASIRTSASSSSASCAPGPMRSRLGRLGLGESYALTRGLTVALLIILALIVALFVGLGFVVKWLFILAIVAALIWLIAFFMRGARA
jgi:hypothetical protein